MTGQVFVSYASLEGKAAALAEAAAQITAAAPRIAVDVADSGLPELVAFGLFSTLPVMADLSALYLPGVAGSLPDTAIELLSLSAAVAAARLAYIAVDTVGWARSEVPTAEALLMLAAWNSLRQVVEITSVGQGPLPARLVQTLGDAGLEQADRWIEGGGRLRDMDPATMPALPSHPAADLTCLLGVVNAMSDPRTPSTVALLCLGGDPPRYVLCLPGLQNATGADRSSADLPGALATLTGHSAYIRAMRRLLASLPPGAQVLLVGHSQGGMVAEALASDPHIGTTTIVGVVTAGSPALATPVAAGVPFLGLRNTDDPVPKLGAVASAGLAPGGPRDQGVVDFSTPGALPTLDKHGLGSGGYLTAAGSSDPRVAAFRKRVSGFLTTNPIEVRYIQVTDSN